MAADAYINTLCTRRGDLKLQGRIHEMVPVQLEILAEILKSGRIKEIPAAWNYLSVLYYKIRLYENAESAARNALSAYAVEEHPAADVVACYEFMLARILAAQYRFAEAVPIAESAVDHYAVLHKPPDDFLLARQGEAALMRAYMRREAEQPT